MGSCELAVMGLESRAVTAGVTKHFVTIFSETCNKISYLEDYKSLLSELLT